VVWFFGNAGNSGCRKLFYAAPVAASVAVDVLEAEGIAPPFRGRGGELYDRFITVAVLKAVPGKFSHGAFIICHSASVCFTAFLSVSSTNVKAIYCTCRSGQLKKKKVQKNEGSEKNLLFSVFLLT